MVFQKLLSDAKLEGSIVIFDLAKQTYYSNDFEWAARGHLPASTFKIVNSIIGLEMSKIDYEQTIFEWDNTPKRFKSWEQDLNLHDAFHYSCVPCYQSLARDIGVDDMRAYIAEMQYGDLDIQTQNIDRFWLNGKSKISQFQQIDFLQRFYQGKLPITDDTHRIMKALMVIEDKDTYRLSGKTGWSISQNKNNAWFVGYVEKEEQVYFFATNIMPKDHFDMRNFASARKQVTYDALLALNIID